jgi:tetratricopeptide (TPR) repeat protein
MIKRGRVVLTWLSNKKTNTTTTQLATPVETKTDLATVDFSTLLNKSRPKGETAILAHNFDKVELNPVFNQMGLEEAETFAQLMDRAYSLLKQGDFANASVVLEKAVFVDLDSSLPGAILKCSHFWAEKSRSFSFQPVEKQSDFLIESYDHFEKVLLKNLTIDVDRAVFNIKMWVFTRVTEILEKQVFKAASAELYLKLGRAHKKRGDYDKAIDSYGAGLSLQKENACLLAELADCYAIIDEESNARVLFREAFYYDAQKIDFNHLESAMILNLRKKVEQMDYEEAYLNSWVAVYGVVLGVFCLSRELKPIEYTQLNQAIYVLRLDLEEKGDRIAHLKPQLIYKLFFVAIFWIQIPLK